MLGAEGIVGGFACGGGLSLYSGGLSLYSGVAMRRVVIHVSIVSIPVNVQRAGKTEALGGPNDYVCISPLV